MTDLTCELHRLHWRLGMLLAYADSFSEEIISTATVRGCADQYNAALDEWLKERETV